MSEDPGMIKARQVVQRAIDRSQARQKAQKRENLVQGAKVVATGLGGLAGAVASGAAGYAVGMPDVLNVGIGGAAIGGIGAHLALNRKQFSKKTK